MRQISDWGAIKASDDFDRPTAGAYIGRIVAVEDVEQKEYLLIRWDFDEGEYKGANQDTFDRAHFWPSELRRSYKDSALGFFKAFKTAVEDSNPGYTFNTAQVQGLVGKRLGIVLGEEEYENKKGEKKTRLYVYQTRSIEAIQRGDFKIPDLKTLSPAAPTAGVSSFTPPPEPQYGAPPLPDDYPAPWET